MNQSAKTVLDQLVGKKPWGFSLGADSVLTMEFGAKDPRQSGAKIHGEWHLWLYICSWRIEERSSIVLGSEDDTQTIRKFLKSATWTPVNSITASEFLDLEISFEDGRRLRTFSIGSQEDHEAEDWVLFTPNFKILGAKAGVPNWEDVPQSCSDEA